MPLDVEIYRRIVDAPAAAPRTFPRRISVIEIRPDNPARTFVFVHGYGGSALQWLPQLRYFGQFAHVVAPDMRGHGQSDDPRGLAAPIASLVDDLALTLDQLQVERPFTLVAHSFGGAIATEYALRAPDDVSELVLIGVPSLFRIHPWLRRLMNIPARPFNFAVKRLQIALYAPLHTLRHLHDEAMASWPGQERLPQLRVPTLVMLGQRDRVFVRQAYDDTARLIPNAQQIVIPVSAHLVQLERPEAVNRAIRRFVASHGNPGGMPHSGPLQGEVAPPRRGTALWEQSYDTGVPEEIPVPRQPLHELLSNAAREFPNRPAILFFGQHIRYRELDRLSNRFAHALAARGMRPGDRVAIILPNIPQCLIAFYGTLKAGGVVVMGSPLFKETEISEQLRDAGATILLTLTSYRRDIARICAGTAVRDVIYTDVREYLPLAQRLRLVNRIDGQIPEEPSTPGPKNVAIQSIAFQRLLAGQPATPLPVIRVSDDLALLQYTSGTVDPPKGVMLTHANLMANVAQVRHWMPDARRGKEVLLCPLPLSHSYGVTNGMNLVMALAAALIPLPTTRTDVILQSIKRYRPTLFPGVPALYLAIANYPNVRRYGVAAIRTCISGSAPLPVEVQEAFEKLTRGRLVEGYGLTEASPVTHCNPLKGERRVGSIGVPLPSTQARIVDLTTGDPVGVDEVGELLIRGPQVMRGYWLRPEDTARALQDGWLHTGDLARMDEDGFFSIVERKKDLILYGAYNVYPREVEEVLYEHPKVLEAAVVGAGDGTAGDAPPIKAIVVLKRGERATQEELLALCRERLDAYKVPRIIEFRNELPKNFVGKILRRLLVDSPPTA
jgi:long-chain acyl-CoA synthetase